MTQKSRPAKDITLSYKQFQILRESFLDAGMLEAMALTSTAANRADFHIGRKLEDWPSSDSMTTGGGSAQPNSAARKRRTTPIEKTADVERKILAVHAAADRRFGDRRIPIAAMASELARSENLGFAEPTIRQILNGTHPPARRLGIGRWQPKSSRGNG
jgi:hypothetical protein